MTNTVESLKAAQSDTQEQIRNIGREDVVARKAMLQEVPDGCMVVYILLNIMNGRDIAAWESALSALPTCIFGRPIYLKEALAQHAISSQGASLNSGYVAVYVKQEAIINEDKDCDALGQAIVGLKPEAVDSKHIIKFVHYNQEVYLFIDRKLVPEGQ